MMPKTSIYLPDDLSVELKHANLPISSICQRALRVALESSENDSINLDPADLPLSAHVASILSLSFSAAARRGVGIVESEDILQAMLDEGESLILRGLIHLGFTKELL
ncbi:hypothetical protein [Gordonia sp. NB41Y]|uniref:hypothetical protein n=1 Tax=Gordonia sp. NB41Y TaxID=875808 RepID=UPI0002BFBAF7|nr:hypothetical protein [Gordonia sp. NB41Y]EMP11102.1 hypothetical protein ISGA_2879 [Gordonia sp. NB41Y]WLP88435.1 hypothetical protein Q9K23_12390 [Gordonia sp. NB41Y]